MSVVSACLVLHNWCIENNEKSDLHQVSFHDVANLTDEAFKNFWRTSHEVIEELVSKGFNSDKFSSPLREKLVKFLREYNLNLLVRL